MTDIVELTHVTKCYGDFTAVDDLNLTVPSGVILGFLGPNGAGKTTTIRMIMSINYPDAGEIRVLGGERALDVKDRIGYLPEERGLYPKMTLEQTLYYFGRLKGMRSARLRERVGECLERIDLADWRKKKIETLSKGMSQKLQFIATILHEPELVILDEPFSGLDPINMELLKDLVVELKNNGTTVIFSTHQMHQAERLCDQLVLINRGRKLAGGTLEQIRSQFSSRSILLEGQGDFSGLAELEGVEHVELNNGHARVELAADREPDAVLHHALDTARLTKFEIVRPDLHEIFVKLVGEDQGPSERGSAADAEGGGR